MTSRTLHALSLVLVAVTAGCGTSATARFYTLTATATSDGAAATRAAVVVGPVSVPASVDRPQFVVQVAPNRVEIDEFNRWAAPLNDAIAQVVANNLAVLLGTADVGTAPLAGVRPTHRVALDVQRFETVQGEAAVVDVVWAVRPTAGGDPRAGRTMAREPAPGNNFDALAAAHSRALAQVSRDIATAIRAVGDSTSATPQGRHPESDTRRKPQNPKGEGAR